MKMHMKATKHSKGKQMAEYLKFLFAFMSLIRGHSFAFSCEIGEFNVHCHLLLHVLFEDDLKLNDYHLDRVNELEKRMHDVLPIYSHIHNTTYMKEIKMNTIRGTEHVI